MFSFAAPVCDGFILEIKIEDSRLVTMSIRGDRQFFLSSYYLFLLSKVPSFAKELSKRLKQVIRRPFLLNLSTIKLRKLKGESLLELQLTTKDSDRFVRIDFQRIFEL